MKSISELNEYSILHNSRVILGRSYSFIGGLLIDKNVVFVGFERFGLRC